MKICKNLTATNFGSRLELLNPYMKGFYCGDINVEIRRYIIEFVWRFYRPRSPFGLVEVKIRLQPLESLNRPMDA